MSQDSTTTSEPFFKKAGDFLKKIDPLEATRKAADTAAKVKQSKDILTNAGKGSSSIPQEKYNSGSDKTGSTSGNNVPYTKYVIYGIAGVAAVVAIVVIVKKMRK